MRPQTRRFFLPPWLQGWPHWLRRHCLPCSPPHWAPVIRTLIKHTSDWISEPRLQAKKRMGAFSSSAVIWLHYNHSVVRTEVTPLPWLRDFTCACAAEAVHSCPSKCLRQWAKQEKYVWRIRFLCSGPWAIHCPLITFGRWWGKNSKIYRNKTILMLKKRSISQGITYHTNNESGK